MLYREGDKSHCSRQRHTARHTYAMKGDVTLQGANITKAHRDEMVSSTTYGNEGTNTNFKRHPDSPGMEALAD